jgi:GTPase
MTDTEHDILSMPPESEGGSTEYKYRLTDLTDKQKQHLASQMTWRLNEEKGQAIYEIGLTDDGFPVGLQEEELDTSLESLREVVDMADCAVICSVEKHTVVHYAESEEEMVKTLMINRNRDMSDQVTNVEMKWKYVREAQKRGAPAVTRFIAEVIIRRDIGGYWETKCGIAGNVDCGKSTLLGVLTSGKYDNGRGSARLSVMTLGHEIATGRSSSVNQQIVGFNESGSLVNEQLARRSHTSGKLEWSDIIKGSNKIVTFFDLAGHLKYLPQTVKGLSSNELDYVLIIVGANMSESVARERKAAETAQRSYKSTNMTREHLDLSVSLGMQCIFVITKIDMVEDEIKSGTIKGVKKLIKEKFAPYSLDSLENVKTCATLMGSGNVIPIVQVSNVTGEGHDILRKLLYYLPPRHEYESKIKNPAIMQIQDVFRQVEGTSTVIAGMLTSGEISAGRAPAGTALKIGPLSDGTFIDARVRSIHCKRVDVLKVTAGKYVCLGLPKAVDCTRIRRNMFAVGAGLNPRATWEFWADIKLNSTESSCVRPGYTPHCFIGHIRQTCRILKIIEIPDDDSGAVAEVVLDNLVAGSEARVLLRFCFRPELIFDEEKKKLVFKEAKTKGIGTIVKTTDTVHEPLDNKLVTKDSKKRPSRRQRREMKERKQATGGGAAAAKISITDSKMTL